MTQTERSSLKTVHSPKSTSTATTGKRALSSPSSVATLRLQFRLTAPRPRFPHDCACSPWPVRAFTLGLILDFPERTKDFEIGSGEFNCPNCRCKTRYRRFERAEYRRVMFVLTIRGNTLENFIVCEKCERRMKDEDLRSNLPKDTGVILSALKEKLRSGQAIQDASNALIGAGMSEEEARRLVNTAAGILLRKCKACALTYVEAIGTCGKCGSPLV